MCIRDSAIPAPTALAIPERGAASTEAPQQVRTPNDQAAVADIGRTRTVAIPEPTAVHTAPVAFGTPQPTAGQLMANNAAAVVGYGAAVAGNAAAVAGAPAGQQEIFDLQHFRSLPCTGHYRQHSTALKWLRDCAQRRGRSQVELPKSTPVAVPEINHTKGPHCSWKEEDGDTTLWFWQEMVAQLTDEAQEKVVLGVDGRSRGLVSCRAERSEKYDHLVHNALGKRDKLHTEWNFILERDNGSCVVLHPRWNNTKVDCKWSLPEMDHEVPRAGRGKSDGKGTFKKFKDKQWDEKLRFDPRKSATHA